MNKDNPIPDRASASLNGKNHINWLIVVMSNYIKGKTVKKKIMFPITLNFTQYYSIEMHSFYFVFLS